MKVNLDFPLPDKELEILNEYQSDDPLNHVNPVLTIQEIVEISMVVNNYLMAIIILGNGW